VTKIVSRMLVTIKPADLQTVFTVFSRIYPISKRPKARYLVMNVTV